MLEVHGGWLLIALGRRRLFPSSWNCTRYLNRKRAAALHNLEMTVHFSV